MRTVFFLTVLLSVGLAGISTANAQVRAVEQLEVKGEITGKANGQLTIKTSEDKTITFKIQDKGVRALSFGGQFINVPATINVSGKFRVSDLKRGDFLRFQAKVSKQGKVSGGVPTIEILIDPPAKTGVIPKGEVVDSYAKCDILGQVKTVRKNTLTVNIQPSEFLRKNYLNVNVSTKTKVTIQDDSLARVRAGDKVTKLRGNKLSNGDYVVRAIDIELSADRKTETAQVELARKYQSLSDEPSKPRDLRSNHFLVHTDISDRKAAILLDKLETMIGLISKYYGRPPKGMIECFVVRDLALWPKGLLPDTAIIKIKEPAGVTRSRTLGRTTKAIVYSCDNHGVVQHEAVHAYCFQTFGSTGPVWYSEGMAEMGQYWKKGELSVNIDQVVIDYLVNAKPKKMLDIVAAGQITGDSWQAYAWRWALCHLLANNPNYSGRFKGLGMVMMSRGAASFETVYGDVAKQISFEYDQFVKNLGNGYRADLCAWQWTGRWRNASSRMAKKKIKAKGGWQPSGFLVTKGTKYNVATTGKWKIDKTTSVGGDGNDSEVGKVVATIFYDYQLSDPIKLGEQKSFVAPQDGQLYFRCNESWHQLGDNSGELSVGLQRVVEKK